MPVACTLGKGPVESATCWIYKSTRREGMYLYVTGEEDFGPVPADLLALFGPPEPVMTLDLTGERRLARADAREVLHQLAAQGYYLQMPPSEAEVRARSLA